MTHEQDINLNIHYSAPKKVWDAIGKVYRSMPYWAGNEEEAKWVGKNIDLWASVEPSGIQIAGTMPDEIWDGWIRCLKSRLTDALGYEIGEPEEGFDFRHWEPHRNPDEKERNPG